jgi:hypothetical protein
MGAQSSPFGGILQQQPITISGGGMSPMSAITQRIMQGGEQLQGSVRGLFGQQTPEQAQQTVVTQLIKNNPNINLNEPEGLRKMAREAMNVPGLENFSINLRQQADILEEKQRVSARKDQLDSLKIINEQIKLEKTLAGEDKTGTERIIELMNKEELGTISEPERTELKNRKILLEKKGKSKVDELAEVFRVKALSEGKPTGKVEMEKEDKAIIRSPFEVSTKTYGQYRPIIDRLEDLKVMESLFDDPTFETGVGQQQLNTLYGLGNRFNPNFKANQLVKSKILQSTANAIVAPTVKQLGANPTDRDLEFMVSIFPKLTDSREANQLAIKVLQIKAERDLEMSRFVTDFRSKNLDLFVQNPTSFYVKFAKEQEQLVDRMIERDGTAIKQIENRMDEIFAEKAGKQPAEDNPLFAR